MSITVEHLPAISNPDVVNAGTLLIRTGSERGADAIRQAVADCSPGRMGATWEVQPLGGVGMLRWGVTTLHPGARPINDGARFTGPIAITAEFKAWAAAKGLNPFAVAKALVQRGGFHPDFGGRFESFVDYGIEAAHPVLVEQTRAGLHVWLERLSGQT